jgi:hypothetical protein
MIPIEPVETVEQARIKLANDWWKYSVSFTENRNNWDFIIGEFIRETTDEDYYSNCFIFKIAIVDKGEKPKKDDWYEWAVSKITGECESAIYFE